MKAFTLNLLLICLFQQALAQVSGQLTTGAGQPVVFANVVLLKSVDSSFVKGAVTDDRGTFRLDNLAPGSYTLRATSLGYETWHSTAFELTAAHASQELGVQIMRADAKQLAEVVIRAEKPLFEQSTEGTVVNVASSVLTKGSSALQVLERSPGVLIDYRNGGIALNGKNGVTVLLNGKPMRMPIEQVTALLNGMSANDIEKIELLTTPGARFDAEGSAGIINIVTKRNSKHGTNGSFSLTGGYGWGEKGTGSLNLAHNTGKVNLYGSYSFLRDRSISNMFVQSSQNMPVLGGRLEVAMHETTKYTNTNHDATVGFDVSLTAKTTLGGSLAWTNSARAIANANGLDYKILPDSLLLFRGTVNSMNRWQNWVSSLYAERKMREGEKVNVGIDYLLFSNNNPTDIQGSLVTEAGTQVGSDNRLFASRQRGFAATTIRVGVVKADYTRQLSPKLTVEGGAKGAYTTNLSGSGIESQIDGNWVSRTETVGDVVMNEGIGAIYTSLNAQWHPSIRLVVGGRYEYSRTYMANPETNESLVDRKLGVFFPNLSFTKKLSDQAEFQVSYTKRISRPSYTDLASFVRYSDPSAVYMGNPLLKPTITHNLRLGYTYRGYSVALLLSRDDNPIARYQLTESPARNLLYVSPQNLAWQNNITLQLSAPFSVNDWWSMSYGFTGGLRQFSVEHTRQPAEQTYFGYSLTMNQTFKLPQSFSAELSGWYNSVSYNGTTKVGGMGALNAGIKKELKNNGGSFQLAVSDLLQTLRIHSYFGAVTEEAFSIKNHVVFDTESRVFPVVKVTYSRSFGSSQRSQQRRQSSGSQDERERVRKE